MPAPEIGAFLQTVGTSQDIAAAARHVEDIGLGSVWVVDQLIAGTGTPIIDSTIALATAAAVTSTVSLGFGALILPVRPVVWTAKQVASLQHVSGDRIILGVAIGSDRHRAALQAAGVPSRERGRRIEQALRVLPGLIAGRPTQVTDLPGRPEVQLSPAATVPPILYGGMAEVGLARTVAHADGWMSLPGPVQVVATARDRLAELADGAGKPMPSITVTMMASITGDPTLPDHDGLMKLFTDPDGRYGMPRDAAERSVVHGSPEFVAEAIAARAAVGAERIVVELVGGDWHRQAELLADAATRLRTAG